MPETIGHVDGPKCFLLVKRAAFSTIKQKLKHEFSTRWARLMQTAGNCCLYGNQCGCTDITSTLYQPTWNSFTGCALLHTASTLVTKVMPQLTNIYLLCRWLLLVCSCRVYHIGWTWLSWNAEVQQTCCSSMCFLKLQTEEYYVTAHAPRLQLLMEQRQRLAI